MSPLPFFKNKTRQPSNKKEVIKKPEVQVSSAPKVVGLSAAGVLVKPHITEKASMLAEQNDYVFDVYPRTNAFEIKRAVEKTYNVKVVKVNMLNIPSKTKRIGKHMGKTGAVRKAIVQIQKGQTIELMPR